MLLSQAKMLAAEDICSEEEEKKTVGWKKIRHA